MTVDQKNVLSELMKKGGPMAVGAVLIIVSIFGLHAYVIAPMVASQVSLAKEQTTIVAQQKEIAGTLQQTASTLNVTAKTLESISAQTVDLYRMMREDLMRVRSTEARRP